MFEGAISVRKPRFPKFIPSIGISYMPKFLALLKSVPSPPMAITRSLLLIMELSERPLLTKFCVIFED